jgi:hypothetical protein
MDAAARSELDAKIRQRGQTLARLLLKRLTFEVQHHFPDARTVRLTKADSGVYEVSRVTGHHNKVLWQDKSSDRLVIRVGEDSGTKIADDAAQYARLAGARLHLVQGRKANPNPEYSVHLHRNAA